MYKTILFSVSLIFIFIFSFSFTETSNSENEPSNIKSEEKSNVINTDLEVANFLLTDQSGKNIRLSDYNDKIVVLEWINPDCPFVKRHYEEKTMVNLEKRYSNKNIVWLAINSTYYMKIDDNKQWADAYNISYHILDDNSGLTGKAYNAKTTPHMYIIDKGKLVYEGAIDDDKYGRKKINTRINYVDNALMQLTSGNPVEISETKPYGCSVKYKH